MERNILEIINDPMHQKKLQEGLLNDQRNRQIKEQKVAEEQAEFRQKYAERNFADFGALESELAGKSLIERSAMIERAASTGTGRATDFLDFFSRATDETRLAILENISQIKMTDEEKEKCLRFLTDVALDNFEERDEFALLSLSEIDQAYLRKYNMDPSMDFDCDVFTTAAISELAKFGKSAKPMLMEIIRENWKQLSPQGVQEFYFDELTPEAEADKEIIDPMYAYTDYAIEQLKKTDEPWAAEIILFSSMLKYAKSARGKIDFEIVKGLELFEKPIGEDLPDEEKMEVLDIARENYFGDVYLDNPEAAQRVIDELEAELFGIDGLKNQRTYTLKYQGRVIAFCRFKPIEGKPGYLYAGSLNVYKDLRGLSVGGFFVRATLGKESKGHMIEAITRADNPVNGDYKKCGFSIGEENPFEKNGVKYFNMTMDRRGKDG